jgi:hypothetical protein
VANGNRCSSVITVTKLMVGKRSLIYGNGRDFPLHTVIRLILGPTHHPNLHVFRTWGDFVFGKSVKLICARPCVVAFN